MTHWWNIVLSFFLCLSLTAQAESDLLDLLNNRSHDRESILRQFEDTPETPPEKAQEDSSANPLFLSPTVTTIPVPKAERAPQAISLILPVNAVGKIRQAAENFHSGCLMGTKKVGGTARIDVYAADENPETVLVAYQSAVANGADIIIGPLLRRNVRMLLNKYPQPPVRTLLLQPRTELLQPRTELLQPRTENSGYYVLSLSAESEAAELAQLIYERGVRKILVVVQYGELGKRQQKSFVKHWLTLNHRSPEIFYIYDSEKDWKRLFERLKKQAEDDETVTVFAAGDAKFVRQTRGFVPSHHPVVAGSFANEGGKSVEGIFLENLMFMEMPFLLSEQTVDIPFAQSSLLRRFFALGADACEVALQQQLWHDGWGISGLSGELRLDSGEFRRRGVMTQYRKGRLETLPDK